ncbi:MAG: carboxypeptidase-like regulatory domain-containing protein [Prevotellaceae bacterium]|jgi:hypothetical protein|nr:carboxypeptidase-like regulatory domain-containing protein [Prevotellaceae bacterium]
MKKQIVFCLLIIYPLVAPAQESDNEIELKVTENGSGSAIPYAVVELIPKADGVSDFWIADENGLITLPSIPPNGADSIRFRSMGYIAVSMPYSDILTLPKRQVELSMNPIMLSEVVVYAKDALIEFGNYVKKPRNMWVLGKEEDDQEVAYINTQSIEGTIQKIKLYQTDFFGVGHPFRLRLYRQQERGGKLYPGEDLLNGEVLIISPKRKDGWIEVNVSMYDIKLPEDGGLFVGIQILADSYYPSKKQKITYLYNNNKRTEYHVKVATLGGIRNADTTDISKFRYLTKKEIPGWGIYKEVTPLVQIVVKKE